MRLAKCDICGKEFENMYDLTRLHDRFQTEEVKDVCRTCYEKIQKALIVIREVTKDIENTDLKRAIKDMKAREGK